MRLSLLNIVLAVMILINLDSCIAQSKGYKYTSESGKAVKSYEKAEGYTNAKDFKSAVEELEKAIQADNNFIEAYLLLGDVYFYLKNTQKAIDAYKKAVEINPAFFHKTYYMLASAEISIGKYEDAYMHYGEFLKKPENIEQEDKEKALTSLNNCEFAINAMKNPVPFEPKNMGSEINREFKEYFPCMTVDGQMILYTRQIKDERTIDKLNEDFFVSYKNDGKWAKSENLGPPVNTLYSEGAPTLSADGQILIFTACELCKGCGYSPGYAGYGSCDLFVSKRTGGKWSPPKNIGLPVNTSGWETQPSLCSDGKTLYFIRGFYAKSGEKHQDIYMTELDGKGYWKMPVKLSNKINTPGIEESVFIHPDGQTLYFSSDGHTGMGGLDIFVSRKDKGGEWIEPVNLGYPINTYNDENSIMISGDGKTAYFASDREGGYGMLDLYYFDLPEQFRPQELTYMKGKVFDKETKKNLEAKFELIDLETGKTTIESYSDGINGEFIVSLPLNKDYALNVSKDGYLFYSENFALKEKGSEKEPVLKDIPMQPIKTGESVILKNIFFETDKYDLKEKSKIELNILLGLLNKNPQIKIELSGHTDNAGDDTHNQILSENRAKAVYDYLIQNGIKPERLSYKGYGETKPIDTNDTEEGRANNRRTEFKITE